MPPHEMTVRPFANAGECMRAQVVGLARAIAAEPWAGLEPEAQTEVRATLIGELKLAIRRMDTFDTYVVTVERKE